jgi:hypothetical protein
VRISGFWIRRAIDTAISLGVSHPGLCLSMSHLVLAFNLRIKVTSISILLAGFRWAISRFLAAMIVGWRRR